MDARLKSSIPALTKGSWSFRRKFGSATTSSEENPSQNLGWSDTLHDIQVHLCRFKEINCPAGPTILSDLALKK